MNTVLLEALHNACNPNIVILKPNYSFIWLGTQKMQNDEFILAFST